MKKIKLGFVVHESGARIRANLTQFQDLKSALHDFRVKYYIFSDQGKQKLLSDFRTGNLDVVLKNSYGRGNEAHIERFLLKHKIPFFGSGQKSTLNGTSKYRSRTIFKKNRLPIAQGFYLSKVIWKKRHRSVMQRMQPPVIVKDITGTDSKGIFVLDHGISGVQLDDKIQKILAIHKQVIVEKFIKHAYEVTCLVVGNRECRAYPPIGVRSSLIFSAKMKASDSLKFEIPAKLPKNIVKKVQNIARRAHKALGCRTFSRADILIKSGIPYLLEVDVHPGFRKMSASALAAKAAGETLNDLFIKFYKLAGGMDD